ncbi:very long-chain acyl-CoA synthetase-like [Arapaima gigas]
MHALFTVLLGLPAVLFLLHVWFPYLRHDLIYISRQFHLAWCLFKIRRSKPTHTILDRFLDTVKRCPEKPFVLFGDERYTYAHADRTSSRLTWILHQRGASRAGDRVALFLENEPFYVWVFLALAKLGCAAALLNSNLRSRALLHCFSCCDASVLVVSAALKKTVEEVLPTLREHKVAIFILAKECDTEGMESLLDKMHTASEEPVPKFFRSRITIKSLAVYIYTSGTTGLSKAVLINHERMWMVSQFQKLVGVTSKDVLYLFPPLYHSSGFLMGLTSTIERGGTIVLKSKFSASQFWDDCRKYDVTVIQYVGEIMRYLCNQPKKPNDRDHKVRLAIGNGIRANTWAEFLQRYGDICISECYGATEGSLSFHNHVGKLGASGRVTIFQKLFISHAVVKYDAEKGEPLRDSRGFCVEVPTGETGLLLTKITKTLPFDGYANNPQQTEKKKLRDVFKKGDVYYNSGDLVTIDKEGFFYFQDRVGDTFRWKGENVATTEVADVLLMVNCTEGATVYGVKVPGHEGRIGMATVILRQGREFDSADTYKLVASHLPSYARPWFLRIQNCFAVTGTYKLIKTKLAEEGFDLSVIKDPLYVLDERKKNYIPMTQDVYNSIRHGIVHL